MDNLENVFYVLYLDHHQLPKSQQHHRKMHILFCHFVWGNKNRLSLDFPVLQFVVLANLWKFGVLQIHQSKRFESQ